MHVRPFGYLGEAERDMRDGAKVVNSVCQPQHAKVFRKAAPPNSVRGDLVAAGRQSSGGDL